MVAEGSKVGRHIQNLNPLLHPTKQKLVLSLRSTVLTKHEVNPRWPSRGRSCINNFWTLRACIFLHSFFDGQFPIAVVESEQTVPFNTTSVSAADRIASLICTATLVIVHISASPKLSASDVANVLRACGLHMSAPLLDDVRLLVSLNQSELASRSSSSCQPHLSNL